MRLFTSGEFAKFCNVPKGTIHFYDKAGLLKPRHISANGYRRYGADQYNLFILITILKQAGCSLDEIKAHLNFMDGNGFLLFLKEKQQILNDELEQLKRKQTQLGDIICCLADALKSNYDKIEIKHMPEEIFEIWPTNARLDESEDDILNRFHEYNKFLASKDCPRYPFGIILDLAVRKADGYLERAYFQRATNSSPSNSIMIKKAGQYVLLSHYGSRSSHIKTLELMIKQIKDRKLQIDDKIFAYDLFGISIDNGEEKYRTKYCIGIV